ncbi:MAG TPA: hypothetical protein VKI45_00775 [Allosphingosinicella sp.]|nr:hypothetical protein [Allosphingosinicella sp.]
MGAIVNAANCTVAPAAGGAFTVTKTGGTDGASDAGAVSAAALSGPFLLRVRPLGAGSCTAGVTANPGSGIAPGGIDYGALISGGTYRSSDAGVLRPGSFPISTYWWVRRGGGTIQYLSGPVLATATLRRTLPDPGTALFFDCAIATAGLSLEVKFDAPGAFAVRRLRGRLTLGLSF